MIARSKTLLVGAGLLAAAAGPARAEHAGPHASSKSSDAMAMVAGPADVKWAPAPPSLPKGMELSVISGNPEKAGPFTLRVRMPPNTVIAPHTHTADENLTVLSGSITHDTGPTLDRARGHALQTNGFVFLPGDMPHALWTGAEPAILQVSGTGPFGLTYVNPADDPSRAATR